MKILQGQVVSKKAVTAADVSESPPAETAAFIGFAANM